ncbi:MAG: short-chain dehydrogenase/reductase [Bacteroidetes bacterium]|jgi:NADP-dependent 3-hydroxy acid dehydrogenase YdfG|nr:short-chain dehydrogenase/reductase [Bacteroidota bacterium]
MIVLVTGATAGIGKATADLFAKNGHHLIITGRRKNRLDTFKKELEEKYKVAVLALNFDVTKLAEVKAALGNLPDAFKQVDILVNNAGLASGLSTIQDGDIEDWEKMINTNVKGLLYVTRTIAPGMVERKKGHIINISSIAGKEVYANGNVYCASKHAVDALNKGMRIDMLQHGIRVTSINPGMIETEFSVVRFHGDEDKAKKVYQGLTPLSAEDIAETIYWTTSRPAHVNINEIIIMPTAQATATNVVRK